MIRNHLTKTCDEHREEAREEEHHADGGDVDVLLAHPPVSDYGEGKAGHEVERAL